MNRTKRLPRKCFSLDRPAWQYNTYLPITVTHMEHCCAPAATTCLGNNSRIVVVERNRASDSNVNLLDSRWRNHRDSFTEFEIAVAS
jgi:hypothetical protein